jgi:hypothetical protein
LAPLRPCRYCQQSFQPSRFRRDQAVCSKPECQRERRAAYHRDKIKTDPEYAEVVRDSQRKWREAHPDYQQQYRQNHPQSAEQNRQRQQGRDRKRRLHDLEKNNLAFDLKRSDLEVWLVGSAKTNLEKNNLASSQLLIFQPLALGQPAPVAS